MKSKTAPAVPAVPPVSSPIKWHGGKSYLAKQIVAMMPPRCKNPNAPAPYDPGWLHYVEPFFGGGNVLFAMNPEGIGEVVNDINGELANFWGVLREPQWIDLFRRLQFTECSRDVFCEAGTNVPRDSIMRAWAFFVRNRQSRQALGRDFATIAKSRTRRGMNELPSAWLSAIDGLPEVHARLKRVVILNDDAIKVMRQQDGPRTLFYLDPPYLHETRSTIGEYEFEMTEVEHEHLLHSLSRIQGRFLLSGYPSAMYQDFAETLKWSCEQIEIDNKASGAKSKEKKIECVWRNFK